MATYEPWRRTAPPEPAARTTRTVDRSAREVRAVLDKVRFHKPETGFVIGSLRGGDSVKGTLAAPGVGIEYSFVAGARGGWTHDARYGWTFAFDDAQPLLPTSSEGVGDYLLAHAPWIGPSVVRRVVEAFGDDALAVLKTDPERVAREVRGITVDRAHEIRAALLTREAVEAVEVDVRGVVASAEVTGRQIRAILDRFGKEAALAVRADPYRLIEDIEGIGWETADRIASAIGFDRRGEPRVRAGIMHVLAEAEREGGHTCMPFGALLGGAASALTVDVALVEARARALVEAGELVALAQAQAGAPEPLVFRAALYTAERAVASAIVQLLAPARAVEAVEVPGPAPPASEVDPLDCLDVLAEAPPTA